MGVNWSKGLEGLGRRFMPYNGMIAQDQLAWLDKLDYFIHVGAVVDKYISHTCDHILAGPLARQVLLESELSSFLIYPSVLMPVILFACSGTTNRWWNVILFIKLLHCPGVGKT